MKHQKKKKPVEKFVLRPNMRIGVAAAEDDHLLAKCFVDTGHFETLQDVTAPGCILLGRTGSGKSALIKMLKLDEPNCINIDPEALALKYISNSNILNFFEALNVRLDIFYKLLWKHVLTIELLQLRYRQEGKHSVKQLFSELITDKNKKMALQYLEQYGSSYWLDTHERVKEVISNIETQLTGKVTAKFPLIEVSGEGAKKLGDSVKKEIITLANSVVSHVQIEALNEIIEMMEEKLFRDKQKRYYLVIDRLDENWVDDRLKHKLIRALIEVIKHFQSMKQVKIVVALRYDLLTNVIRNTRDPGFQEEKYKHLYIRIEWDQNSLATVINTRIQELFKHQYTNKSAKFEDIFRTAKIGGKKSPLDYILDRSLLRPRDAILFVNECIEAARGKSEISFRDIRQAEKVYSEDRLRSLYDEWHSVYPYLPRLYRFLEDSGKKFFVGEIRQKAVEDFIVEIEAKQITINNSDLEAVSRHLLYDRGSAAYRQTYTEFVAESLKILHEVGIIGLQAENGSRINWKYKDHSSIPSNQITEYSSIHIHPMFWMVLNLYKKDDKIAA